MVNSLSGQFECPHFFIIIFILSKNQPNTKLRT